MRRKALLTAFVLFLSISGFYAQPCPPYPAAQGCGLADPDCANGLDGYCSTLMPQDQITENIPGCGGAAVLNNDDWIAFYAGSTTITVVITPSNCQSMGGNMGIQAGFYAACDDDGGVNGDGLASNPLSLQCGCTTGPVTLDYSSFVIGQTYFIMIDGCGGDICDYVITVTQGSTLPSPPPNPVSITGPTTICPGAIVTYTTQDLNSIPTYLWTIIGGTIISQDDNTVQVQWTTSGSISVYGENDCFTTTTVSLNVTVQVPPPGNASGAYCAGSTYIYPGNGQPYTAGSYTILFPGAGNLGCDSSVVLNVIEHPTPFVDVTRTICEGEQVTVGGVPYNTTGQWNIVLETTFGCDSTVYLDLTVLDPYAFVLQPPPITCVVTQVVINGTLSSGDAYEWTTFDGCINGGNSSSTVTACSGGTYCLTVTNFGFDLGAPIECTDEFCITVVEDNNGPNLLTSGTNLECESDNNGTVTVTVTGGAPAPFIYVWNTSPIQPTQTATGLTAGTYCTTVTSIGNGCTSEACFTISAPPAISIDIIGEDIECNGENTGSATAVVGGGAGGFTFEWSPGGQTTPTVTGLGAGVYTVLVTDANDCTEESSIELFEPVAFDVSSSSTPATCNGQANGSASITVSGGMGVLTYSWNTTPVQDSSTAVNLTAGDYTVIVTDANDCSVTETITVTQPTAIALSSTTTQTSCNNTPDGSATVTASGGTPGYTYSWNSNPVQTTPTAINLISGTYTVVVTDGNDCTATLMATVSSPNGMTIGTNSTNALCNGGAEGSATVTPSGGTPGYTYNWDTNPVQTTPAITGLTAGTYNVTIEDMNGCEEYETFVITEPTAVSLSSTTNDALCSGDTNGSATVVPSGGTGTYTYSWNTSPVQTTATANGLGAGSYTVIVTDANGCTESETVLIDEPVVLSLSTSETDALCNQQADGTATVVPAGGTGAYTYSWNTSPAQTTATAINLLAGNYTVIVEDANGCTEQASVTIGQPAALALQLTGTDPDCNQSQDGVATVSPSGGTGPYSYSWNTVPVQTTATASGLDGGSFTVIVTDANGCTENESIVLTAPPALTLTTNQSNILCYGESTGSAAVVPSGGTAPYTYEWNDGASQNTATATNLIAGSYTVTVTDENDCTAQITVNLSQPAAALNATGTSTDALCGVNNGTIDLTVTGGTAPYTYVWSNNDTNQDPQNLGPGTYTVVITDVNDCTFTASVQVSTPSGLEALVSVVDVNCNGESNGMVDITVNGGIVPYTYIWSNAATTQDLIDVPAGNYGLTLTDADGCVVTASAIVGQPAVLQGTATPSQASCGGSDGSISLVVSGGTTPYGFAWENDATGDMYMVQSPNGLPQGSYTGVITDAHGCSLTVMASVTVPNGPVATISAVNLDCFEDNSGSIELEVVGGDMPYTYEWINDSAYNGQEDLNNIAAGTWEVLITDDNNCSTTASIVVTEPTLLQVSASMTAVSCNGGSDGTLSAVAAGGTGPYTYGWNLANPNAAPAGSYTVIATDANGCTAQATITVTQPTILQASATATDVDCNGASTGSLQSNVMGGVAPYTYAWSGGSTNPNPTGLAANTYTLIVTDANGCTASAQAIIGQPAVLSVGSVPTESTCGEANGSINLTVTGGVTPYGYLWSNGDTNQDPGGLLPDVYIVTITDANGCTMVFGDVVTTPSALTISGTGENVDCYGASTGSTDITVGGGTMPFTYLWDDGNSQTVEDAENLPAGTYTVLVTDANGCTISTTLVISQPPVFEVFQLEATGVSCNGGNDGSIVMTVTGGTIPYVSYEWDNTTQIVPDPDNLNAGTYTLTVTDAQGCTAVSEAITLEEPEAILLSTTTVSAACNGSSDGSINLTVQQGTPPFTYSWNNGAYAVQDPSGIPAGQYTVVVTDANGCTETTTTAVGQPQALQIVIDNVSNYGGYNVTCWNSSDGTAEAIANGGTIPYSYSWSNGMGTGAIEDLGPGLYTVTVTDGGGCTNTTQVSLTAPQPMDASVSAVAVDCHGESDGQILISSVSGGASPYMYSIGTVFSPVNQFVNLPAGEYEVTVQDVNGCEWATEAEVTEPEEFVVTLGEDVVIQMGDSTQLHPVLSPFSSVIDTFVWKEREVVDYEPWVMPWQTQSYSIIVTNQNGCKAEDMILVRVNKDRLVYVPNAFSPNNDGFNDILYVYTGRGVKSVTNLRIFSRWGELVFELDNVELDNNNNLDNGWDGSMKGEPLNPGVFVYVVEVEFIDGRVEIYKGDITLAK